MPNDNHDELGRFTFSEGSGGSNTGKDDSSSNAIRNAAGDGGSAKLVKKPLKRDDIKVGAKFITKTGIEWNIDSIEEHPVHGTLIRTSMSHGKKGNYRDPIDDVVHFLNSEI